MIRILQATITDIPLIQEIAHKTWPITYGSILSDEQLEYMLDLMYSNESLLQQLKTKPLFFLAYKNDICLGFISCENNYQNKKVTRLHKIYILPEAQGKGVGNALIEKVVGFAKENQSEVISLNVNKFNKAVSFYKKIGFEVVEEEDLDIGNGYLMEDYKMELKL
ncbi:GNAT family N-acetyltransferase [Flavobacterium alvei]|uniref:GNAT family N-acetyltransferase n=1 Tax=Flavobacterium alvei TaxID=2080416 RepID=UPI0026ECF100|nr:GNAT family N-acetyltransferase [Flavobacterium alvei]